MRGIAALDRQPGSDAATGWIASHGFGVDVANVDAVLLDFACDPDTTEKVRSLTRCRAAVASGTTLEGWPIDEPLTEPISIFCLQRSPRISSRITISVKTNRAWTRSKVLAEPSFPPAPNTEVFASDERTPHGVAYPCVPTASGAPGLMAQDRLREGKRTVQPKTGAMSGDMNEQSASDVPAMFTAHVIEQPLV